MVEETHQSNFSSDFGLEVLLLEEFVFVDDFDRDFLLRVIVLCQLYLSAGSNAQLINDKIIPDKLLCRLRLDHVKKKRAFNLF